MQGFSNVSLNSNGGYYENGKPFSDSKWASIFSINETEIKDGGSCTIRRLAELACISTKSASKTIDLFESGIATSPKSTRGNSLRGVGSLLGWQMQHHAFLYDLYRDNPSMPVDGYVEEFLRRFGMTISKSTVERWFRTIGPFKGTMRVTSRYPSGRNSWTTIQILRNYLAFILSVHDHSRLVFADEKPMKEVDVYMLVRRDPVSGNTPNHTIDSANSKNRYSILAAVNVKGGNIPPVQAVLIEKCTDSSIFLQFIRTLLDSGVLQRGDIFVLDNCTIHMYGDNVGTQQYLFEEFGILMITLPPYHPDFNPTELVFNTTLQRLSARRARYKCWRIPLGNSFRDISFKQCIIFELDNFTRNDILSFYHSQGYAYELV